MSGVTAPTPDDIAASSPAPDESLWERRMRALTMRNAGATYARIADQMGLTTQTVRADVRKALREVINETAEDMLARQRSILLDLTRSNYAAALSGDRDATGVILRVLEHEAKLFGLYAPTRVAVGVSDTEFAEQAAELIASLGLEPPRELARAVSRPVIDADIADVTTSGGDSVPEDASDLDGYIDTVADSYEASTALSDGIAGDGNERVEGGDDDDDWADC